MAFPPYPDDVSTRADAVQFILSLRQELLEHPERWENDTLDRFLEAMASWLNDAPGWFKNHGKEESARPDWQYVAHMLAAATMYE